MTGATRPTPSLADGQVARDVWHRLSSTCIAPLTPTDGDQHSGSAAPGADPLDADRHQVGVIRSWMRSWRTKTSLAYSRPFGEFGEPPL